MLSQQPGVDAHNLWGVWTQIFVLLAVGTFFALGYAFLGAPVGEGAAEVWETRTAVIPGLQNRETWGPHNSSGCQKPRFNAPKHRNSRNQSGVR